MQLLQRESGNQAENDQRFGVNRTVEAAGPGWARCRPAVSVGRLALQPARRDDTFRERHVQERVSASCTQLQSDEADFSTGSLGPTSVTRGVPLCQTGY